MPDVDIHIDLADATRSVGLLRRHATRRAETITFEYDLAWLADANTFSLEPALGLTRGVFAPPRGQAIFGSIGDSAPDTWGRRLMQRSERRQAEGERRAVRTLTESDYLLGVSDETRLGALRFRWTDDPVFQAPPRAGVPALIELGRLLQITERILRDEETDEDLQLIFAPGSSLGGARPKASVIDQHGHLAIAKFPKETDDYSIETWEEIAMRLADRAGIATPHHQLLEVAGKPVLLSRRFDRRDGTRLPFLSAMSMTGSADGERGSYPDLVDALAQRARTEEGWKWCEASIDFPHAHGFRRVYPHPVELSDDEEAAYAAAHEKHAALSEKWDSAEELPPRVAKRLQRLEEEIASIDARRRAYDADDVERGGVFVVLSHEGQARIERGFIRPEDEAPEPEAENVADGETAIDGVRVTKHGEIIEDGSSPDPDSRDDEEPEGDADHPISDLITRDLTARRTLGLRLALGEQPDMALIAVTHALAAQTFYLGMSAHALEIRPASADLDGHAIGIADTEAAKLLSDRHVGWAQDMPKDVADLWDFIAGLDPASVMALFAHCASLTVNALKLPWERKHRAYQTADRLATALALEHGFREQGRVRETIHLSGGFHVLMAELSGNAILAEQVRLLVARTSLIISLFENHSGLAGWHDHHGDLIRLCAERKVEEAVAMMREHIIELQDSIALDRRRGVAFDMVGVFATPMR